MEWNQNELLGFLKDGAGEILGRCQAGACQSKGVGYHSPSSEVDILT